MKRSEGLLLALALVVVASALISPGSRDLYAGDESAYARIVAEMETSGDLLLLRLGGAAYTDKPPLHFWIVRGLTRITGTDTAWPYVLPSLLGYIALIALLGWLGRRWLGEGGGGWTAFIAATSILLWGSAQTARMDVPFALAITAAVGLVHEGLERRRGALLVAGGFVASIATMIKGPAALAIVVLVWMFESFRLRRTGGRWAGAALVAAAAFPLTWIQMIAAREGNWVAFDLLVTQNVGRSIDSFAHAQPPWYFLERFPVLFFPWSIVVVIALIHALSRTRRAGTGGFLGGWFLSIFLLFSLVSGKLDVYLLPAIAPAALLVAAWMREGSERAKRFAAAAHAVLAAILALAAAVAAILGTEALAKPPEAAILAAFPVRLLFTLTALLLALAAAAHFFRPRLSVERSILAIGLALYGAISVAALSFVGFFNQVNTSRPLVAILRNLNVEDETLVHYEAFFPWGRGFDFGSPRIRRADPWTLKRVAADELPVVVVTRDSRTTELGKPLRERYEKRATARIRRKNYDVWVRSDFTPPERREATGAASGALPLPPRVSPPAR